MTKSYKNEIINIKAVVSILLQLKLFIVFKVYFMSDLMLSDIMSYSLL